MDSTDSPADSKSVPMLNEHALKFYAGPRENLSKD
jgi:hypothetical protein